MAVEEAEGASLHAKEALISVQTKQIEYNAKLSGERSKLLQQIERLEAERNAALSPISQADLSLYEGLRKTRNGVAVVIISSRACSACGATLTAALVQTSQSTGLLVRCPTCGRILYPG